MNELVNGGNKLPNVAENEEPDDGERDPGQPALALSQQVLVTVQRVSRSVGTSDEVNLLPRWSRSEGLVSRRVGVTRAAEGGRLHGRIQRICERKIDCNHNAPSYFHE